MAIAKQDGDLLPGTNPPVEKSFRCARCPAQIKSGEKIGRFTYCEVCGQVVTDELLVRYEAYTKAHVPTKIDPLRTFSGWIEKFVK